MNAGRSSHPAKVLYIASRFPALSETFVWQELLEVRRQGISVTTASLYTAAKTSDPVLESLRIETMVVYCEFGTWLLRAGSEVARYPARSLRTVLLAVTDAFTPATGSLRDRLRFPLQAVAAMTVSAEGRRRNVTHIHAHMANSPATVAMYAAYQLRVPFSFTGHANDLFVHRCLLVQKLRRSAFVVCISRWHRDLYKAVVPLADARAPIIRCGVAPVAVPDSPSATAAGVNGPLRILAVGRLVPKKGFDLLLAALAQLDVAFAWTCSIIGEGPQHARLDAMVRQLGLSDRVSLLGSATNETVLGALRATDLFVLPCRVDPESGDKDGIPVVLMEAMAAGVPCIAGDLPAIRELVIHSKTGLLVPRDEVLALTEAISRLAASPEIRAELSRAAKIHVQTEFDRSANAAKLIHFFRSGAGVSASANATLLPPDHSDSAQLV